MTESGVSHCHFQVTETSNPLSIVGPHTFEKTMGVNTLFTLHPCRPHEGGFDERPSPKRHAIRQIIGKTLSAKHNPLQLKIGHGHGYSLFRGLKQKKGPPVASLFHLIAINPGNQADTFAFSS
ncbi:hypothetical protein [Agrobacterium cavarae]|uniref:hypothetical protein n=1 Tax=Agrobacterium cavarae TaxID=2528239 RepID=UPI0028B02D0A|nr:hypothetical protein [Agrobacterium cavarae]